MTSPCGKLLFIKTAQMRIQAGLASSQHLPIWHRMSLHFERRGRLEAAYHNKADFAGNSEAAEGLAQH